MLTFVTSISNVSLGKSSYVQRHIDLVLGIYFISHYCSMVWSSTFHISMLPLNSTRQMVSSYKVLNILPAKIMTCTVYCGVYVYIQNGATALYIASDKGHVAVVELLLQKHANVSICKKVYTCITTDSPYCVCTTVYPAPTYARYHHPGLHVMKF